MNKVLRTTIWAVVAGVILACCSQVVYLEEGEEEATTNFGIVDFRKVTDELVDKLAGDTYIKTELAGSRPTLLILPMRNLTDEYVDTNAINQSIRVRLSRARLFSFVNREILDTLGSEAALQQAGIADTNSAVRLGRLVGAQYGLVSELSNIRSISGSNTQQIYYRITMMLVEIETGLEVWIEEAELSKRAGGGFF